MKRLLVVVVLSLLAAAILPTSALASHDIPTSLPFGPFPPDHIKTTPGNAWANGAWPTPCGNATAKFRADSTSISPQFEVKITFIPPCLTYTLAKFDGDITCLNATGYPTSPGINNGANWAGVINNVTLTPGMSGPPDPGIPGVLFPGMGVVGRWIDNWLSGTDRAFVFTLPGPLPCSHPLLFAPFSTLPITSGNLEVHDG